MWKYVSRRIRDSVERTCNVLETRRTWTCGNGTPTAAADDQPQDAVRPALQRSDSTNGAYPAGGCLLAAAGLRSSVAHQRQQHSGDGDRRQQTHANHAHQQGVIGALTWSGAIIAGWYTSQLVCMRQRRHRHDASCWTSLGCPYAPHPHSVALRPPAGRRPLVSDEWLEQVLRAANIEPDIGRTAEQSVSQSADDRDVVDAVGPAPTAEQPTSIADAAERLLHVIGDIEYRLGVRHLNAERYEAAVAHFKLATGHRHAGATYNLGLCYELGLGTGRDARQAFECFALAARLGHATATYNVAVYHGRGLGGAQRNRRLAKEFMRRAALLGEPNARRALRLTPLPAGNRPDLDDWTPKTRTDVGWKELRGNADGQRIVAIAC